MTDSSIPAANGFATDLGHNIRAARKTQDVTLRELARRVGISASALSQIETGKTRPTVKTAYEIARRLGVTLGDLSAGAPAPRGADAGTATSSSPSSAGHGGLARDGLVAHLRHAVEFRDIGPGAAISSSNGPSSHSGLRTPCHRPAFSRLLTGDVTALNRDDIKDRSTVVMPFLLPAVGSDGVRRVTVIHRPDSARVLRRGPTGPAITRTRRRAKAVAGAAPRAH